MSEVPAPRRVFAWALSLTFVGALGLRLFYLHEIGETDLFAVRIGDGHAYDLWARTLLAEGWFGDRVFYQAPLYPYFLALQYAWLGDAPQVPLLVQCVLGAASCVLLGLATRRFFTPTTGLLAAVGLALYPTAIFFDGLVQKASLAMFLLCALLCLLGELRARASWPLALAAGATLGLLGLTRENALAIVPVVAAWLWLGSDDARPRRALHVAGLLLGVALVLSPVALRNRALGGEFQLTTSQLGPNFYIGNHPGANGRYQPLTEGGGDARREQSDARLLAERASGRALGPGEVSDYWLGRALDFIREQPAAWIRLTLQKLRLTFHAREIVDTSSIEAYADHSTLLRLGHRMYHMGVLLPLALLGLWATRARWRELWLWPCMAATIALSVTAFYVLARYRFSLVPLLLPFAAAGVACVYRWGRERQARALLVAAVALAPFALAANWPLADRSDPRATTSYALGLRLAEEGRLIDAVDSLDRAHRFAPQSLLPLLGLAETWRAAGRADLGIAHLRQAHAQSPRHALTQHLLADALLAQAAALQRQGQPDDAIQRLRELTALADLSPEPRAAALTRLSWLRSFCAEPDLHDPGAAQEMAREASTLLPEPWPPALHDALANADAALQRPNDARRQPCRASPVP